jgi:hypothetical protein
MDFSDAENATPTQILETTETREGVEYQVKLVSPLPSSPLLPSYPLIIVWSLITFNRAAKFTGITSLTIFLPSNTSDGEEDTTRVYYIGLRGKYTSVSYMRHIIRT